MSELTFIDWFSGIGGFRKGMETAGHKCVGFCEYDKYAVMSYTSMFLITDKQREYLSTLSFKERQKEILKDEYRNNEWYANDVRAVVSSDVPRADCWCFGSPCQDFSVAGRRKGLEGDRSSLIREIFRLLRETGGQDRPEWLIYENVYGMFSSNRGFDYLSILSEMDELGYDVEWQSLNTKNFGIPQNRLRVFTIGHLRAYGAAKILPITPADREDSVEIEQIGHKIRATRSNPNEYRVYDPKGLSPCLNKMDGGGREPMIGIEIVGKRDPNRVAQMDVLGVGGVMRTLDTMHEPKTIAVPVNISNKTGIGGGIGCCGSNNCKGLQGSLQSGNKWCNGDFPFLADKGIESEEREVANTLTARENRGLSRRKQEGTVVCMPLSLGNSNPSANGMGGNIYDSTKESPCLTDNKGDEYKIAVPITGEINVVGLQNGTEHQKDLVLDPNGVCKSLESTEYKQPRTIIEPIKGVEIISQKYIGLDDENESPTLAARDYKEPLMVTQPIGIVEDFYKDRPARVYENESPTLRSERDGLKVAIPVVTPEREKRQNGRRFKENGDPSFTLTAQDRHGVAIGIEMVQKDNLLAEFVRENKATCVAVKVQIAEGEEGKEHPGLYVELENGVMVYAVWYEKYQCYITVRRLMPIETFRLQGWDDEYFERAAFVNSDSQLYKQAGNGVTVSVVCEIAKRLEKHDRI